MTGVFVRSPYGGKDGDGWVEVDSGCHIWTGAKRSGYGYTRVEGVNRFVHRLRYEREIGPIPHGMVLDHFVCDNGAGGCCNPHHCRPATVRENTLRGRSKAAENARKTHCPRGHPLEGDNLVDHELKRGYRTCKKCYTTQKRERDRMRSSGLGANPAVVNASKTHCPKGHPLVDGNLVAGHLRAGKRRCRLCKTEQERTRRAKRKGLDGIV